MNGKPVKEIPIVPRRPSEKQRVHKHDAHDDCFCSEPIKKDEATPDERLPAATGGVDGDA